jgi:hypothetical protein
LLYLKTLFISPFNIKKKIIFSHFFFFCYFYIIVAKITKKRCGIMLPYIYRDRPLCLTTWQDKLYHAHPHPPTRYYPFSLTCPHSPSPCDSHVNLAPFLSWIFYQIPNPTFTISPQLLFLCFQCVCNSKTIRCNHLRLKTLKLYSIFFSF